MFHVDKPKNKECSSRPSCPFIWAVWRGLVVHFSIIFYSILSLQKLSNIVQVLLIIEMVKKKWLKNLSLIGQIIFLPNLTWFDSKRKENYFNSFLVKAQLHKIWHD